MVLRSAGGSAVGGSAVGGSAVGGSAVGGSAAMDKSKSSKFGSSIVTENNKNRTCKHICKALVSCLQRQSFTINTNDTFLNCKS